MSTTAHYAIIDEAGDIGQQARSTHYLVGVAMLTQSLHGMQRVAGAVRKQARKRKIRLEELKARLVPSELVQEGLACALEWEWGKMKKRSGALAADSHRSRRIKTYVRTTSECQELSTQTVSHSLARCKNLSNEDN